MTDQPIPAHIMPEALKLYAAKDKVFNAMATAFALRERTRNIITIQRLVKTMKDHGFDYSREEYREVLVELSYIGLGRLIKKNGKVRALTDIKHTLMSIGQTALGQKAMLDRAKMSHHYAQLVSVPKPAGPIKHVIQLTKDTSNPLQSVSVSNTGIVFQFNPKSNLEDTISAAVGIYKTMAKRGSV